MMDNKTNTLFSNCFGIWPVGAVTLRPEHRPAIAPSRRTEVKLYVLNNTG
jgi:hypothetical protein